MLTVRLLGISSWLFLKKETCLARSPSKMRAKKP
jgi:hypothetical protein